MNSFIIADKKYEDLVVGEYVTWGNRTYAYKICKIDSEGDDPVVINTNDGFYLKDPYRTLLNLPPETDETFYLYNLGDRHNIGVVIFPSTALTVEDWI